MEAANSVDQNQNDDRSIQEISRRAHLTRVIVSCLQGLRRELWPVKPVIICLMLAGFSGGFLSGLIGVGGPPLIAFFFVFDHYKVGQVRWNITMTSLLGGLVKALTYFLQLPPAGYPYVTWYNAEDTVFYVVLVVSALAAVPLGIYLARYLNKDGYKVGLCVLLLLNGLSMIITGGISIMHGGTGSELIE